MSPPRDRAQALETNGYTSDGGAGLEIFGDDSNGTSPVTQNGNVFEDNVLTSPPGASNDYFGGGEYAQNVDLQSTDDTFTQNELPGTSDGDYDEGGSGYTLGAGLALVPFTVCDEESDSVTATLDQDAVIDNSIQMHEEGNDTSDEAAGAGIGFSEYPVDECEGPELHAGRALNATANVVALAAELSLDDSSVTDNAVVNDGAPLSGADATDAVAGIAGDDDNTLELDNTILYGDLGGTENRRLPER